MHCIPQNNVVRDHHIQTWPRHGVCILWLFSLEIRSSVGSFCTGLTGICSKMPSKGRKHPWIFLLQKGRWTPNWTAGTVYCSKTIFYFWKTWTIYVSTCWTAERVKYGLALISLVIMLVFLSTRKNPKYIDIQIWLFSFVLFSIIQWIWNYSLLIQKLFV